MPEKTMVLVHGAWHGSWVWSRVIDELKNDDVEIQTVELPSCGEPGDLGDLRDDVEAVRSVIEDIDGPVVLVGHSYGGMAITEAAAGADNVAHLVYVCAFMLDEGESLLGAVGGKPPEWWRYSADESYISADTPRAVFYNDCDAEVAAESVDHLKQFSAKAPEQTLDAAAWREVGSTYVICTKDKAIPPEAQEAMSGRASRVTRMDASHSPFLSKPGALAHILRGTL